MSVEIQIQGHVAVLLLDEPQRRNALSRALVSDLHRAMDEPAVRGARAIVFSSTGPFFSAGANIHDLLDGWMVDVESDDHPVKFFERLSNDPRLVVAAVDGPALGGGFELMLSSDLAVASPDAWFCLPELEHGVIPNTALMRMQQIIGLRRALYYTTTGERVDSQMALHLGLVNQIAHNARNAAILLAQKITSRVAPSALAVAKANAHHHAQNTWFKVRQSLLEVSESQWREGLSAFIEKRAPNYDIFWSDQPDVQSKDGD
jgi:enoyl-CoA hydratase